MKILILSRFDIFHLMSPEARASLQRSSLGNIRESIESRALKSMAWEKYKKRFFDDLVAPNNATHSQGPRSPSKVLPPPMDLGKSQSTPVLSTTTTAQTLVDPGTLVLVNRRELQLYSTSSVSSPNKKQSQRHSSPNKNDKESLSSPIVENSQKLADTGHETGDTSRSHGLQGASNSQALARSASVSALDEITKLPQLTDDNVACQLEDSQQPDEVRLVSPASNDRTKSIQRRSSSDVGPQSVHLAATATLTGQLPAVISPTAKTPPSRGLRHGPGSRSRHERHDNATPSALTSTVREATIWDPVHGVCQPFAVVGFLKEALSRGPSLSSTEPKPPKPTKSGATNSANASLPVTPANLPGSSQSVFEITHFRVLGKFRDVNEAMELFRRICTVETRTVTIEGGDRSRFAIYKEADVTMVLENFSSVETSSDDPQRQFGSTDLRQANGQRYACVGVTTAGGAGAVPLTVIEAVTVLVFQCFPTPQSAIRFARQMSAQFMSASSLYIVPLFEWVPLADLEQFDARNTDLEQALEHVMLHRGGATYTSTWKARKDAVKRTGGHHQHRSRQGNDRTLQGALPHQTALKPASAPSSVL